MGDYLPNCLRSCLDRRLVLCGEGNLGRNLPGNLDRYSPGNPLHSLTGNPGRSLPSCRPDCVPGHLTRNLTRYLTGSGRGDSFRNLRDYEVCRPPDGARGLVPGRRWVREQPVPDNPYVVVGQSRNHNSPVWGTDWRPPPGLQSSKV